MKSTRLRSWKKAQVSIEFMFIFILFIAVLTLAVISTMQNSQAVDSSRQALEARQAISLAKGRLDTAFLEGDGFASNLTMPQEIMGFDYSVTITPGFLYLDMNNQTYSSMLLSKNITGSLRKGENSIRNAGGIIVIS